MLLNALLIIAVLGVVAYYAGYFRALSLRNGKETVLHSLPTYHGAFVASWTVIPSTLLVLSWIALEAPVINRLLLAVLGPEVTDGLSAGQINLLLSQIRQTASGLLFIEPEPYVREAAVRYNEFVTASSRLGFISGVGLALAGLLLSYLRVTPSFRARQGTELVQHGFMIVCATLAIVTTAGIFASLIYEASRFFERVPINEFLFGLNWEPQIPLREDQVAGAGAFGAVPVFTGTLLISSIALAFAIPVGFFTAIYMTEFAAKSLRVYVKPLIEILAGVPTIVYGFFAVQIANPFIRSAVEAGGLEISPTAALIAGLVMGIMLIPFISSITDDAIQAVPQSMRDGSLALGATKGETVTRILVASALPGIMGGILLATSRAIGETMIVVMASGIIASLTFNPLDNASTVTVQIVTLLIGDTEFDNPKTLAAFALGLVLFLVTLVLNIIALRIVQKYREQYE